MLKELFQDLWAKAQAAVPVDLVDINGMSYTDRKLTQVLPPEVPTLVLASLSGLVDFIKTNRDEIVLSETLLTVDAFDKVSLRDVVRDPLERREKFAFAKALDVAAFQFDKFTELESFAIAVQTRFVDDGERRRLLALAASITSGPIRNVVDDGVSQEVTLKAGVTLKASQEVRNPFTLRPFRTFSEIEQPASPFIFRVQQSRADNQPPTAALFEADGGAWRITAMATIRDYLRQALPELAGQIIG